MTQVEGRFVERDHRELLVLDLKWNLHSGGTRLSVP